MSGCKSIFVVNSCEFRCFSAEINRLELVFVKTCFATYEPDDHPLTLEVDHLKASAICSKRPRLRLLFGATISLGYCK